MLVSVCIWDGSDIELYGERMSKTFVIQRILPQAFVLDNKTFVLEWEVSEFTLVFAWACPDSWLWPLPFLTHFKVIWKAFFEEEKKTQLDPDS